jgi:positive regulator of sigma E activity
MSLKKSRVPEMKGRSSEDEIGIVTALKDKEAIIELSLQENCESCGARFICVPDQSGIRRLRVSNPLNAKVGNQVTITEKSNFLLKVSFFQYGVPFIGFLLAIFLLNGLELNSLPVPKELILFLGGIAGLFIAGLISRLYIEKLAETDSTFFEISKIVQ